MSLLGFDDGAGCSTGNGYLDIVDFILQGCVDVGKNLRELYRRVVFNIMFGNTDDHFRNYGFLLTSKGWTLSPAYDINPGTKSYQCLLIDQYTEKSYINTLLSACHNYMLEQNAMIIRTKEQDNNHFLPRLPLYPAAHPRCHPFIRIHVSCAAQLQKSKDILEYQSRRTKKRGFWYAQSKKTLFLHKS